MAIGKCLKCDTIAEMTEDHVFPKWLKKALPNFGIKVPETGQNQLLCGPCNQKKGGSTDYSHVPTRNCMKELVVKLVFEIRKHEEFNP